MICIGPILGDVLLHNTCNAGMTPTSRSMHDFFNGQIVLAWQMFRMRIGDNATEGAQYFVERLNQLGLTSIY